MATPLTKMHNYRFSQLIILAQKVNFVNIKEGKFGTFYRKNICFSLLFTEKAVILDFFPQKP